MKRNDSTIPVRILILILISCLSVLPAIADDSDRLIDRALTLSGVTGQLDMLGGAILGAIPGDAFPDSKTRNRLSSLLRQAAGKEKLLPLIRQSIRENFSKEKIEQVIGFYDSRVGRKVGRIANNALEPRVLKEVREGRNTVTTLSEARLMILGRIAKAEQATQSNVQLLRSALRGLVKGYIEGESSAKDLSAESRRKLEAVDKEIRQSERRSQEIALTAFAYMFRSLRDDELEKVAAFYESDAASWFRRRVQAGLDKAVFTTAVALGEVMIGGRSRTADQKPGTSKNDLQPGGNRDRKL